MTNPQNPEKCFGRYDGYLHKCWQAHSDNNCDLIEKCYQEFLRKEVKRSGNIFTVKENRRYRSRFTRKPLQGRMF